jgi:hypothetical protein
MADNYYDATGVLILDRVTPVITALFGAFNLDASYPGDGQAYIARISGSDDPQWDDVRDGLAGLVADLGLALPDQADDPSGADLLRSLAAHFGAARDEELDFLIQHGDAEGDIDLDVLFQLAIRFDDGHRLAALVFEGGWHCSQPRLFEFGGDVCYLSRALRLSGSTSETRRLGAALSDALLEADVEQASAFIFLKTVELLGGIRDGAFRRRVHQRVAEQLTFCPD